MPLFSFSIFSDRWSLKIENENNITKKSDRRSPIYKTGVPRVQFINTGTYPAWLELPLTETIFIIPSLFEPLKFYCSTDPVQTAPESTLFVNQTAPVGHNFAL